MTVKIFVEGMTEKLALEGFCRRWLEPRVANGVRIRCVQLAGSGKFRANIVRHVQAEFNAPNASELAGTIGLLDWLRSGFDGNTEHAKQTVEKEVNHTRFAMHFAIQETEAWLLSQPSVLPAGVAKLVEKHAERPEQCGQPAATLQQAYRSALKTEYRKTVDGRILFNKLDPEEAARRCPGLNALFTSVLRFCQ